MKHISHHSTLFYYDGPQVFEARDAIGGHYIATSCCDDNDVEYYIVAGVEPDRLRQFRIGQIDLLALLLERPTDEWYLTIMGADIDDNILIELQSTPLEDNVFLPDPGFVINYTATTSHTLIEARARQNVVLETSLNPPETSTGHRISAGILANFLSILQSLVHYAYSTSQRVRVHKDSNYTKDAYLLDVVVPAAPGSFKIVFEPSFSAYSLFQDHAISIALDRLDSLFQNAHPDKLLEKIRENRGRLAGAYQRLLNFLVDNNTSFSYSWAQPEDEKEKSYSMSFSEAEQVLRLLSTVTNLTIETLTIEGKLSKVDIKNGTWRIENDDEFSGRIKDGQANLNGLVIGSVYQFNCDVQWEEMNDGREHSTLYLVSYKLLS